MPHHSPKEYEDMADIEQPEPTGVSRRTVTKAMAWAVPVVAIASTAPLAAASPRRGGMRRALTLRQGEP